MRHLLSRDSLSVPRSLYSPLEYQRVRRFDIRDRSEIRRMRQATDDLFSDRAVFRRGRLLCDRAIWLTIPTYIRHGCAEVDKRISRYGDGGAHHCLSFARIIEYRARRFEARAPAEREGKRRREILWESRHAAPIGIGLSPMQSVSLVKSIRLLFGSWKTKYHRAPRTARRDTSLHHRVETFVGL